MQLIEWIVSRKFSTAPQPLITEWAVMALKTVEFLQQNMTGVRDLRVVFLRAVELVRTMLQVMDRKLLDQFNCYGGQAVNLRRNCAYCGNKLSGRGEPKDEEHEEC